MESTHRWRKEWLDLIRSDGRGWGWLTAWTLAILLSWTLLAGIGSSRLWDRDEPRNARCSVAMLESGDWVVPTFNGQLRTHKPILLYWAQMLSYSVFGTTEFAARLPSALSGLATVLILYRWTRDWYGRDLAIWSSAALGSSLMFVVASRAATPDGLLIFFSTLAVMGLVRSQATRDGLRDSVDWSWLAIGYAAMGIAMLAKGPIGLVMPSIVSGIWLWSELHVHRKMQSLSRIASDQGDRVLEADFGSQKGRQWSWLRSNLKWLLDGRSLWQAFWRLRPQYGVAAALAIAAPWYVVVGIKTEGEWLVGFFLEHNVSRAVQSMEGHRGGPWYYPIAAIVGLFPNTLMLIPAGIWYASSRPREGSQVIFHRLGIVWMTVYLMVFSMASTKLPSYITPCYPGAALLFGGFYCDWSRGRFRVPRWLLKVAAVVVASVGLAVCVALVGAEYSYHWDGIGWVGLWTLGLFGASAMIWRSVGRGHQRSLATWTIGSGAFLVGGLYFHGATAVDLNRSDLEALIRLHKENEHSQTTKWMALGSIEPSWVYYMKDTIYELPVEYSNPGQVEVPAVLAETKHDSTVRLILDANLYRELPMDFQDDDRWRVLARVPRFGRKQEVFILERRSSTALTAKPYSDESNRAR